MQKQTIKEKDNIISNRKQRQEVNDGGAQETETVEENVQETEMSEGDRQETEEEEEGPGLEGNEYGARRKTKRKGKKKKKKKKEEGSAMLSCLAPLQLVAHFPDGSTDVIWENDLCNSALGGEFGTFDITLPRPSLLSMKNVGTQWSLDLYSKNI